MGPDYHPDMGPSTHPDDEDPYAERYANHCQNVPGKLQLANYFSIIKKQECYLTFIVKNKW